MKILVIQTAFIGDLFLTLPFLQQLKERNNSAKIDVITTPAGGEIFGASPVVNEVIVLDKKGSHRGIIATVKFALKLKKRGYDIVYSPHRSFRSSLIVWLIGAEKSIGFTNASASFVYSEKVKYEKSVHEVARNLSLLDSEYLIKDKWRIKPELIIPERSKGKIERYFIKNKGEQNAAIAPGSVWATKIYPAEYFRKIIKYLTERNFKVFLIGGKNEFDLCEDIKGKNPNVLNCAGKFRILESVYLISLCNFLISNDSAPVHMAMAAGVKALTIYTSTTSEFGFYPYLYGSGYLSYDNLKCKPCGIHGKKSCPLGTFDCGRLLKPEKVIDELKLKFFYG